jgi:hypothetical protein
MQEAVSVAKAIEKAWLRAEKPQSFSIKVLEEPIKNFFGITTKSAKIAFFFEEELLSKYPSPSSTAHRKHTPTAAVAKTERVEKQRNIPKQKTVEVSNTESDSTQQKHSRSQRRPLPTWTPALVQEAQQWLASLLEKIEKPDHKFSVKVKNNHLIFSFEKPFSEDSSQERLLFSTFAYLMIQSLKNKLKHNTRGLKVILQSS